MPLSVFPEKMPEDEALPWTGYLGDRFIVAEDTGLEQVSSTVLADPDSWCGGLVLQNNGKTLYWLDPRRDRINVIDTSDGGMHALPLERALDRASRLEAGPGPGLLWCLENDGQSLTAVSADTGAVRTVDRRDDGSWTTYAAPVGDGPAAATEDPSGRIWLIPSSGTARVVSVLPETWAVRSAFFVGDELYVYKGDSHQLMSLKLDGRPAGDWPLSSTRTATATLGAVANFASAKMVWPGQDTGGRGLAFGWDPANSCILWQGSDHSESGKVAMDDDATGDTIDGVQQPFFRGTVALCFDPLRGIIYAADPANSGVLGIRVASDPLVGADPYGHLSGASLAFQKPLGTSRTLVVGLSTAGRVTRVGSNPESDSRPFTKLLEPMYNLERSRRDWKGRMQTLLIWENGGYDIGSSVSLALSTVGGLRSAGISRVLVVLTPTDPLYEANSYEDAPDPDDLGDRSFDAEWASDTLAHWRKNIGPLTRSWIKALQDGADSNKSFYTLRGDGTPIFDNAGPLYRVYDEPKLASAMMARFSHALAILKERLLLENVELDCVILPLRNQLGPPEMVGGGRAFDYHVNWTPIAALRGCLEKNQVHYVDLSRPLWAEDPLMWPIDLPSDDHFMQAGHWMIAHALAEGLNDLDGPNLFGVDSDPVDK
jgi:hypothetical protein